MPVMPYKTALAWIDGKRANNGAMRTDGTDLWSYGLRIGTTDPNGNKIPLVARDLNQSPTTKRHMQAMYWVLDDLGFARRAEAHQESISTAVLRRKYGRSA